ncbi:hypothetical protein [Bacillus sp. ISL-7]|uniref:SF0329 family protein n=1 Tax=Bacillus sp. ISL-7 TaxID=2819136 RepID=UPI001BEBCE98|nr:hypothetical protein [Bacillus sp. ISL-7]MBT2733475.1 hypothetical protein [Bacillus sp. ISL-7]
MGLQIKWSKLKKIIESRFCDKLIGRVNINYTNYRAVHEPESRFWITLDGAEIYSNSKVKWLFNHYKLRLDEECMSYHEAEKILEEQGQYYIDYIEDSLCEYINLSISDAINSKSFLIRALGMIDKRLGKRRLQSIEIKENEHILVRKLYAIRSEVEKINSNS